jgi:hypothetical protein
MHVHPVHPPLGTPLAGTEIKILNDHLFDPSGMRASVHVDLPGWTKEGLPALKKRCEELHLQPRGTRGESGGQTG